MNAEILSIGSELMAGVIADTNAAFLSARLTELGFRVSRHTAVGDRIEDITAVLRETAGRADVALVTGGIGPTPDDLTRDAFAALLSVELVEVPEAAERIRRRFAGRGMSAPRSNFKQARIPKGAQPIPNPLGTACGFSVGAGRCRFFCLPGVPAEMREMFIRDVKPVLGRMYPSKVSIASLKVFGLPESLIGEKLEDIMGEGKNPEIATQVSEGIITIRITASGGEARALLERTAAVVRERLGSAVIGETSLEERTAALLMESDLTLAVAESCTGGLVSSMLTDVPGISRVFMEAAVTYSNEAKMRLLGVPAELIERRGAVSAEVAEAMASGVRRSAGTDLGLAVTGIAGPTGATPQKPVGLVYIALADGEGVRSKELRLTGPRKTIKDRAAKHALDMLRLHLEARSRGDD